MAKQFELNDASSSQFELFDASSSPNQDNMPQEITKVKPVVKKETESKYQLLLSVFNISIFILGALTISWGFPASHSLFLIRAMQISTFMINSPSPTSAPFIDGSLDCEFYKQTTKHVPSCDFVPDDPSEKLVIPLLISATPRSGTHHTKTVLQSLGLDVSDDGHFPGKIGTVSWVLAFRDNIRYQTGINFPKRAYFEHIVHQVRHPLASITSMACTEPIEMQAYRNFIGRKVDLGAFQFLHPEEITDYIKFQIAIMMWVRWHEFLDQVSEFVFQMESMDVEVLKKIVEICGCHVQEKYYEKIEKEFHKVVNARDHREVITWKQLRYLNTTMAEKVASLALKYGYEVEANNTSHAASEIKC